MARHIWMLLVLLAAACGDRGTPTESTRLGGTLVSIAITGPKNILPGATAQFTAMRTNADGTTADATKTVLWRSSNTAVISINVEGVATTRGLGEAAITASSGTLTQSHTVTVAEDGTFILRSTVVNSLRAPLVGALVEVVEGTGAGLRATTDQFATANLYGVAGQIRLRLSASGYEPAFVDLNVTRHTPIHFLTLPGEGTGWTISGVVLREADGKLTPEANVTLDGWIDSPTIGTSMNGPKTDATGHFQFTVPSRTTRVWIIPRVTSPSFQTCAAAAVLPGDQFVEVQIAGFPRPGAWLPTNATQHVLSGVVNEQTADGPRGVRDAYITLDLFSLGDGPFIASTVTNSDGRYALCVPVALSGASLSVSANGYQPAFTMPSISGPTTLDILLRPR